MSGWASDRYHCRPLRVRYLLKQRDAWERKSLLKVSRWSFGSGLKRPKPQRQQVVGPNKIGIRTEQTLCGRATGSERCHCGASTRNVVELNQELACLFWNWANLRSELLVEQVAGHNLRNISQYQARLSAPPLRLGSTRDFFPLDVYAPFKRSVRLQFHPYWRQCDATLKGTNLLMHSCWCHQVSTLACLESDLEQDWPMWDSSRLMRDTRCSREKEEILERASLSACYATFSPSWLIRFSCLPNKSAQEEKIYWRQLIKSRRPLSFSFSRLVWLKQSFRF